MTRATATVLFTDLVGSTELRSRLGEEAADELRRRHDRLLAEAVELHGGRVVKGLGDGIMATFACASDAVAAAVAIQQAVDRLNHARKGHVPLGVRVGLSAGAVTFEDDDVHGTPVVEAARLCAAARGGGIFVSEVVRLLAGLTDADVTNHGSLEVKGLQNPVSTWEVRWEPARTSTTPMPALLSDVGRIFVGRDAELEELAQLWKEVEAGERRIVLLAGEPGVGKTRLAAEVAAQVHRDGATVLAGRCDEDLGVPYQPFVEALRHFVDHTARHRLGESLGRYAGELVRFIPELSEQLNDLRPPLRSDPETERYRLFDAVAAWLGAVAAEAPVLLVVDDLQWAAKPTLLLLRHLARSAEAKRLLVIGTYRDTDLRHDHALIDVLADLRRHVALERLSLTGLDRSAVVTFMEQAAGHDLTDDDLLLARVIHAETEGNPLFVREVLRHLTETGAVDRRDGRWTARLSVEELGIPEGVRDVVGRRLSRLSPRANEMLRVAAVAGAKFELAVVQAAGKFDENSLLSALEEGIDARLVSEDTSTTTLAHRFAHSLVRDTLYQEVSAARRVVLHRRVAEAIEVVHAGKLDDYLPALAHHWARASAPAPETRNAVAYARRAGDRALAQLAHDEAVAYYRQALELLELTPESAEDERLELLIRLGEAERRSGDPGHRVTLLAATRLAQNRGDAGALARAALANNSGVFSVAGAVDEERVAAFEAALQALGTEDIATRAKLLATLALELIFGPDRSRCMALSDRALTLARELADAEVLAHVLIARYYTMLAPETVRQCLADTVELVEVVQDVADPAVQCRAYLMRQRTAVATGDLAEGDRALSAACRLAAELGQPVLEWQATYAEAGRSVIAGRLDEAQRLVRRALELGRAAGRADAEWAFAIQLGLVRFEQGRLDQDVQTLLMEAMEELAKRSAPIRVVEALLALVDAELGQMDEATAALDRLSAHPPPRDLYWVTTAVLAAAAAVRLGDRTAMKALYRQLLPHADETGPYAPFPTASVAHHLGLLAVALDHQAAQQHFTSAAAIEERLAAPIWLARTRLELARVLLTGRDPGGSGDSGQARDMLTQVLATARELGLPYLEEGAVALLEECP